MIVRVGVERAIICVINRTQRVWHGDLVPLVSESRKIGERPSERPRAAMLDRVKDGGPYVVVKRRTLYREL